MKSANMSVEQTRLKSQFGTFVRIQRSEDWIQVHIAQPSERGQATEEAHPLEPLCVESDARQLSIAALERLCEPKRFNPYPKP